MPVDRWLSQKVGLRQDHDPGSGGAAADMTDQLKSQPVMLQSTPLERELCGGVIPTLLHYNIFTDNIPI
jgi:hypothetical protein